MLLNNKNISPHYLKPQYSMTELLFRSNGSVLAGVMWLSLQWNSLIITLQKSEQRNNIFSVVGEEIHPFLFCTIHVNECTHERARAHTHALTDWHKGASPRLTRSKLQNESIMNGSERTLHTHTSVIQGDAASTMLMTDWHTHIRSRRIWQSDLSDYSEWRKGWIPVPVCSSCDLCTV